MRVSYKVVLSKKWAVKIRVLNFMLIKFIFRDPNKFKKKIKYLQCVSVRSFESPRKKDERNTVCSGPSQYLRCCIFFFILTKKKKKVFRLLFFFVVAEKYFRLRSAVQRDMPENIRYFGPSKILSRHDNEWRGLRWEPFYRQLGGE